MSAVIYVRVSTTKQVDNMSLSTQERLCRDFCAREGLDVLDVFVERGESAKTADREVLNLLLKACQAQKGKVTHVVVYALSRFSRNTADHLALRAVLLKAGVLLRSVTESIDETSGGRFMESIFAAVAQLDNDVRGERTVAGMRASLMAGRWTFAPPLGYRKGSLGKRGPSLEPDPDTAELVREAFRLMETGLYETRAVLSKVTSMGLRSRAGKPVLEQSFRKLLENPLYAGLLRVKNLKVENRGDFEALISEETFQRVQAVFASRRSQGERRRKFHPDFPLRQFIRCACGKGLTASFVKGNGGRYGFYRCLKCSGSNVRMEVLEARFVAYLEALRPKQEFLRLFHEIVLGTWRTRLAETEERRKAMEKRVDDRRAHRAFLLEQFRRKRMSQDAYDEELDACERDLALARMELNEAQAEELDVEAVVGFAEHVLRNASSLWKTANPDQRRKLQSALFPEGLVWDGDGFETAASSPAFNYLRVIGDADTTLVALRGIEPRFDG